MTLQRRATLLGDPSKGKPVACLKCSSEVWEETESRDWIWVEFDDGRLELPVFRHVLTCQVCGEKWTDDRATHEDTNVIHRWRVSPTCRMTPSPDAFCVDCGDSSILELGIRRGYFDPASAQWEETPEAESFRWVYARAMTFGCRSKPKNVTN